MSLKLWVSSFVAALFISYGLFLFMNALVSSDARFESDQSNIFIDFSSIRKDSDADTKKRQKPKEPPKPEQPKDMKKIQVTKIDQISKPSMKVPIPKLSLSNVDSGGPFLGKAEAASGDGEALSLVRIEPQYPRKAAMQGIEGWVLLQFDITAKGTVANVSVLDAKPRKIFNKVALKALLKWRFKPKMEEGVAVVQKGQKINLDFKLNP